MMSLLLIVGMTGCSGMKNSMRLSEKNSSWNPLQQLSADRKEDQDEDAKPVTMAAIWADSVYEKPGLPNVKGFGGRIFFYDADNTAVKADGELIVYGFDESNKEKTEYIADRKFVFPRDKFQSHYSENDLGAAYSVWVPWEKMGGYRKSITLIPMFKTADGTLIKCGQYICTLPGREFKKDRVAANGEKKPYEVLGSSPAVVSQAGYHSGMPISGNRQAVATSDAPGETHIYNRIKTSTIQVTPSMSRRMADAAHQRMQKKTADSNRQPAAQSAAVANAMPVSRTSSAPQSVASEPGPVNSRSIPNQNSTNQQRPAFGQPAPWTN